MIIAESLNQSKNLQGLSMEDVSTDINTGAWLDFRRMFMRAAIFL